MNRRKIIAAGIALALMGGGAGLLVWLKAGQKLGRPGVKVAAGTGGELRVVLPEQVPGFVSQPLAPLPEEKGALPRDTTFGRRFYQAPDGFRALVSVVLMGADRTSIHQPQFCLTGQGWNIDRTEATVIAIDHPRPYSLPVMKLTTTKQLDVNGRTVTRRGIYVYWFVADGLVTARHWQRMWWMAGGLFRDGILQRWAYVSCFSDCAPGEEEATFERMRQFIAAATPEFQPAPGLAP